MSKVKLKKIIDNWQLPEDGSLLEGIERMIYPALLNGYFASSSTAIVGGLQYHLGGEKDTEELAKLASISSNDHVLDVCCYLGGPAIQLADFFRCKVTGIDISEDYIAAAKRIAELSGLSNLVSFVVGDAANLPFKDGQFTVVWNQASIKHSEIWLKEFDRALTSGGRLALTFDIRKSNPDKNSPKWTLEDFIDKIKKLGYSIIHAKDITERDIEVGWRALDRKLSRREKEFIVVLGKDWVRKAHKEFAKEIKRMREGRWGNGRIIAIKK